MYFVNSFLNATFEIEMLFNIAANKFKAVNNICKEAFWHYKERNKNKKQ